MTASQLIIGTAGHIDHGKTSLVRALTGVNLDRTPEEQSRGITISLGFTHAELPDGRLAAFVDVPGHERLVRTMIAGATGLDAVVLCVSATEGVMPQTKEHLAILDLLGVERGFVALTMCDLADDEMLELARLDVEDAVQGTFLEGAPILDTASGDHPQGLDAVREQIATMAVQSRPQDAIFRLPIDRAFIQRGFGTVVTGTARGGSLSDGSEVWILPIDIKSRVRGLQVHGAAVEQATPGQRTAMNLAGIERDDLARGMVVVSNPNLQTASVIDAKVRMLPNAATIPSGGRVRLLVGTAEVLAVAEVIEEDALVGGQSHWVQFRTETPIVAVPHDRFIIRRESPLETLGGGVILDPWAPRARRKNHEQVKTELEALAAGDNHVFLSRAGMNGLSKEEAAIRGIHDATPLANRRLHADHYDALCSTLVHALEQHHAKHPLEAGAPRRALHTGTLLALSERTFDALITQMMEAENIVAEGPTLRLPSFSILLTPEQQDAHNALNARILSAQLEGIRFSTLVKESPDLLQLLLNAEIVERVADQVVHSTVLEQLIVDVRSFFDKQTALQPADFKAITGLSRKHAIPLLEWLDGRGITRREGSSRVIG
ncbi:MAG: selenocysteine-specific translation elongation factor, partial [Myxococcota bacterium]